MKLGIVGAGFVGLSIGAVFAEKGHSVVLVDVDREKIKKINSGEAPFYEPGLKELLEKHAGRNLRASEDYSELLDREIIFICVGTPSKQNGEIDLRFVEAAARSLAGVLKKVEDYKLIAVKSTVIPTTTERVVIPLLENSGKVLGKDFGVCVNPEFLREGSAIRDFLHQDRVVIGANDKSTGDMLEKLYRKDFPSSPIVRTDLRTAEMIKYASNAFLATKISFINEIGNICKKLNIDVYKVVEGMKHDPRIGASFLRAGMGFGGSCFPKDVRALANFAKKLGEKARILEAVLHVNEKQPEKMIEIAKKRVGTLKNKKVAVLGLAFKPGTSDTRESRALPLILKLIEEGAEVVVYDPVARLPEEANLDGVKVANSLEEAVKEAEVIKIATEWEDFKELEKMKDILEGKLIIEGRRMFGEKPRELRIEGICW